MENITIKIKCYCAKYKNIILLLMLAILINFVFLFPLLGSGYFSDDSINSYTNGMLQEKHLSVFQFSKEIMYSWIQNGRFFPLAFYYFYLYHIINNLFLYKLSIILMVIINELVFSLLIYKLTKSKTFSICSLVLPPLLFQFRMYHDPILSFHWLEQIIFLMTIASLLLFNNFIKVKNKLSYICSIFIFFLSLLIYEVAYSFVILFLIICCFNSKTKLFKSIYYLIPYLLSIIFCGSISIFLRIHFHVPLNNTGNDGAYVPNYNLFDYFGTLFKQSISSFPLNYYIFDPHKLFSIVKFIDLFTLNNIMLFILFLIFFLLIEPVIHEEGNILESVKASYKKIILFGISLTILPGVLISLSPRYQKEVTLGIGYIPVYISYFGIIILITFLMLLIFASKKKFRKNFIIAFALILGAIASLNNTNNILVIEKLNEQYLYPRQVIEEALKNGMYNNVLAINSIIVSTNNSWDVPAFYMMHTHKSINNVVTPNNSKESTDISDNDYYLNYYSDNRSNGYSITGKIYNLKNLKLENQLRGILTENLMLYVKNTKDAQNKMILNGTYFDMKTNKLESFRIEKNELQLLASGDGYGLYSLNQKGKLYDIKSVNISYVNNDSAISILEKNKLFLNTSQHDVLHISLVNNGSPYISFNEPIILNKEYSIELLVKPNKNEIPYSSIIGNHPGLKGHEGFVIQRLNTTDFYNFTYGNGEIWNSSKPFLLDMDSWNYIAVNYSDNNLTVYKNGQLISKDQVNGTIANSTMPLYLYNWMQKDRNFNGVIDEFRFSNTVKTDKEIQETWRNIQLNK